jgi:hypothetical protein
VVIAYRQPTPSRQSSQTHTDVRLGP